MSVLSLFGLVDLDFDRGPIAPETGHFAGLLNSLSYLVNNYFGDQYLDHNMSDSVKWASVKQNLSTSGNYLDWNLSKFMVNF